MINRLFEVYKENKRKYNVSFELVGRSKLIGAEKKISYIETKNIPD